MDKVIFVFNKFITNLIKDLKKTESLKQNIRQNYKAIDKLSHDYIDFFTSEFSENYLEPDYSKHILKELTIQTVIDALNSEDKDMLWNYYYVLSVLASVYKELQDSSDEVANNVLCNNVFEILTKKQKGEDVTLDIDTILHDDIQELLTKIKYVTVDTSAPKQDNPFMNLFQGMENSKICNLAQEISNDIDVSNIKVDNPDDIMKLLDFSGSNNVMGDIIKKVSTKMNEKITSGELKQEELLGEAMSMMGKMNLGGLFNNPMMSEMMKMAKKGKAKPNSEVFKSASNRDRLRKKLEERRKKSV